MILFIDTTDFNALRLVLADPAKSKISNAKPAREVVKPVAYNENYKTLAFLESFLRLAKITPQQLSALVVCSGPGSFTGIRVGVALAQAMAYALDIPLAIIKKSQIPADLNKLPALVAKSQTKKPAAKLHNGRKPNISIRKKQK